MSWGWAGRRLSTYTAQHTHFKDEVDDPEKAYLRSFSHVMADPALEFGSLSPSTFPTPGFGGRFIFCFSCSVFFFVVQTFPVLHKSPEHGMMNLNS